MTSVDKQEISKAVSAFQQGRVEEAQSLCESLLTKYPREFVLLQILGMIYGQKNQLTKAKEILELALKINSGNIHVLNNLGLIHKRLGEFNQAKQYFLKAIRMQPQFIQALYNLAQTCQKLLQYQESETYYSQVLQYQPKHVDSLVNYADLLLSRHESMKAEEVLVKALELEPEHFVANLNQAKLDYKNKNYEEVIQRLQGFQNFSGATVINCSLALGLLAQANDKKQDYRQAFDYFQQANDLLYQQYKVEMSQQRSVYAPNFIMSMNEYFAHADFNHWRQYQVNDQFPSPTFILGFPRSGTTLLDQILNSHSEIFTLEEKENLIDLQLEVMLAEQGIDKLWHLSEVEIKKYRTLYWQRIKQQTGELPLPNIVIDKLPLSTVLLAAIYRLFPDAKIIFAIRDPRDVVLSCYQQRFGMNESMFQFLKLESAVDYYCQVMKLGTQLKSFFPLKHHIVFYERIVGDLETEIKPLLSFLGLSWQEQIKNYQTTALSRKINTPSAQQVIQPLYKTSIEKWRNYQQQLQSVLPKLETWVRFWGYS